MWRLYFNLLTSTGQVKPNTTHRLTTGLASFTFVCEIILFVQCDKLQAAGPAANFLASAALNCAMLTLSMNSLRYLILSLPSESRRTSTRMTRSDLYWASSSVVEPSCTPCDRDSGRELQ